MAWYTIKMNNEYFQVFNSSKKVENYMLEEFETKSIDGFLCDKKGDRKSFEEIFAENGYEFLPLKIISEKNGILENDISHVHIEDGQLVITTKDYNQIKIQN